MSLGKIFFFISFLLCTTFAILCWTIPFQEIYSINEEVCVTGDTNLNNYGNFVTAKYNEDTSSVDFLLFNAVKIHSVNAFETGKKVLLGGQTLGFSYHGDGVLVVAKGDNCNGDIEAGDIIKSINGQEINSIEKLTQSVNSNNTLNVKIIRNGKSLETKLKPSYDVLAKKYKLGVWARENMSGIGTLTFIDPVSGRFGALGHPILEKNTKAILDVESGDVHECTILGVKKAVRGSPGELQGVFVRSKVDVGEIDKNCESGMYGTLNLENKLFLENQLIEIGGRMVAHPGKAQIYSSIDGKEIKSYDIEIIKTNYQNAQSPKNLVFKVIDKDLIEITGGIVQGMSGSPIVQDGKLIGAVTHVFVNDATKGFGIYIDTMLQQ